MQYSTLIRPVIRNISAIVLCLFLLYIHAIFCVLSFVMCAVFVVVCMVCVLCVLCAYCCVFPHYTFTLDPVEDKARPGFVAKLETKIKLLLNLNSTQPHHNQIFSRILGVLH